MKNYNIVEARKQLGKLLDLAILGEEVIITRHGKDYIKLVPVEKGELEKEKKLPSRSEFRSKIKIKGKSLSKTVIEKRKKSRY
ncbi:MAG: type II toxin-antitoxin system Phd/YefM family antitoxin [Candidatus Dadabacteria bacterium]|nr:type II toxin-antitoxin system Phd/YefM family antitoxin [Candidatus Dadabacteria bacterium]NIS08895.1 type II toxin-antitoxin system Phd/YefM family antitoxin [Candidatus Dadabacteria bacterium]NIV42595.1 type II toxin-antitoxin system prevent-host-death family antitoxin [Candidatus Dadabacteria bacterium]NIY22239.1 type II toxin-antitoxin system prevent-host-death family antitoxin [Candidatus Dadabacteria bacterium]